MWAKCNMVAMSQSTNKETFFKLLNLAATTRVKGEDRKDVSQTSEFYYQVQKDEQMPEEVKKAAIFFGDTIFGN